METSQNNQIKGKNFYLTTYLYIRDGVSPAQICKRFRMSKAALNYYMRALKRNGLIEKIGYGVWRVKSEWKEVKKSSQVAQDKIGGVLTSLKSDSVRGHAFLFVLKLPVLEGWGSRRGVLSKQGVVFRSLGVPGGGESLFFRGRRVWLTGKSVVVYERASFLADTGDRAKSHAVSDFLNIIRGLESLLGVSFRVKGNYVFRVARAHYALVKNALAQQYDREGKKLNVYSGDGLWFLIDNSFNLHEAEAVHPKTGVDDVRKVQDFFNGIKVLDGFTPKFVVDSIGALAEQTDRYAKNIELHLATLGEMRDTLKAIKESVKK